MIFVVYADDPDSSSGISFSGIFDNRIDAENWARSEGPDYKVLVTSFGPIEWNKLDPIPPFVDPATGINWEGWDYDPVATKEVEQNLRRENEGLGF